MAGKKAASKERGSDGEPGGKITLYIIIFVVLALIGGAVYYWVLPWSVYNTPKAFASYVSAEDGQTFYVRVRKDGKRMPSEATVWRIDKLLGVVPLRVRETTVTREEADIVSGFRDKTFVRLVESDEQRSTYSFFGKIIMLEHG